MHTITHPTPDELEEQRFVASVQRHREEKGWSQGELARRMVAAGWDGFHQTTISRIEKGTRPVRLGESRSLASIFGTTVSQMVMPAEEDKAMWDFGDALANLRAAEKLIRDGVEEWEKWSTILRHELSRVETLDPSSWKDATLVDRYEQLTWEAQRRLKKTPHSIVSAEYEARDKDAKTWQEGDSNGLDQEAP